MKRTGAIAVAAVLGLAGLVGCGSSDNAYCDTLKSGQQSFKDANAKERADLKRFEEFVDKAEAAAPGDVKADWAKLTEGVKAASEVDTEALRKDPEKAAATKKKFAKLQKEMETSNKNIKKDTEERCDLKL